MGGHLYLHVPFCFRKCRHCSFYSVPDPSSGLTEFYVRALETEARLRFPAAEEGIKSWDTVYFGGGTPTLLGPERVDRIIGTLAARIPLSSDAEVTIEANPLTVGVSEGKAPHPSPNGQDSELSAYRKSGITRISVGLQSFRDNHLKTLGRLHTARDGVLLIEEALAAGLFVNVDLIYGLPGQSLEEWVSDLHAAVELGTSHISCYWLTLEDGTPLADEFRNSNLLRGIQGGLSGSIPSLPDDELGYRFFVATHEILDKLGFPAYEVSNFSKDASSGSRHNLAYWNHSPYLGLGPSAHSFDGSVRSWNKPDLDHWLAALTAGQLPPRESEELNEEQLLLERVMLAMRMPSGIDISACREATGIDLEERFGRNAKELEREGLISTHPGRWQPTLAGLALSDRLPLLLLQSS